VKTVGGVTVSAPEWSPSAKAATDTQAVPAGLAPWLTTYDRTVVRAFRRPVVSDLLGQGTLGAGSNAVSYLVEGAVEGSLATVAEGGAKPQFHIADPTTRTDALKKIAGFLKFTDEMAEDADFWVSEINQRGLYLLALAEENQLLNGDGTGNNILGLLNRSGIQTETAADNTDNADAIYRALAKVQTATGLTADGIVINPVDYQALRLSKDGNGQYFGGGFFQGEYGNGGIEWQPPLWGVRTIVSAAVAAGTAAVAAFSTASTVYRKGGVRVESTNSHASDFTNNLITTRIEERVALANRIPAATVEVTLSNTPPA
jgi:HK97 family phage major capsid protein